MIRNYFITAWRNLIRNKVISLINVVGLSIGISAALVIFLVVQYDFSFDKFHQDGDRIYRVVSTFNFSGEVYKNSGVPAPMGKAVQKEISGLDITAPFRRWDGEARISIPANDNFHPAVFKKQSKIVFVDENYFNLIRYQWIAGAAKSSLQQPYQVVLTEANAQLYFPKLTTAQIIGREIIFDDTVRTTVTGIVKNLGQHSDFSFQTFLSKATLENTTLKPQGWDSWESTSSSFQLFIKLAAGTSPVKVQSQVAALFKKYHQPRPGNNGTQAFTLQPLDDLHSNADYDNFDQRKAHKPTLYGLLAIAIFLLLLGCINFINLTTAQASHRAKEIGIRKTMGSSKKQLLLQFLNETFFITVLAAFLSIALAPLLLKMFSDFIPPGLGFNLQQQPGIIVFLILLIIGVSILSGFYPALVLSRCNPVTVLKNQLPVNTGKTRKAWLRKTLTISQFIVAQVFIMATLMVSKQIHYTLHKDLGFKKDAIICLNTNYYDTNTSHKVLLLQRIKAIPEVTLASLSMAPPSSGNVWSGPLTYQNGKDKITTDVQQKFADSNYLKLYQIKLLAGKNLETTDTVTRFLINQTYARILGFNTPEKAIGKIIDWDTKRVPIAGVVADFHQISLHETIRPLVLGSWGNMDRTINIALHPQNADGTTWKTAINKIEKAWKEIYPKDDFEYSFLDETLAQFYEREQHIANLLTWAMGLAIFISCMGLLGLVIYTTNTRTKEIGIRKVLGASVSQIVSIISKDFIQLVLAAFVIATPIAWWAIHKWLEDFAYRTTVSWWVFALAGSATVVIALITISFQTIRSAVANPVKSLRTE